MANKKKSALPFPIEQILTFAALEKEDKCTLSLPISDTESHDIEVKKMLSADEMVSFVEGVTNALFLNDEYIPALYEMIFAKAIIAYYTNLDVLISNEELVALTFNTDIVDKIEGLINQNQLDSLVEAIYKHIEYKQQEFLNSKSARLEDTIQQIELLTDVTSKIAEQFKDIDIKQIAESSMKLANIPERELVNNIINMKFGKDTTSENVKEFDNKTSFDGGDENV